MSHTKKNPLISGLKYLKRQAVRIRPRLSRRGKIAVVAGAAAVILGGVGLTVAGLPALTAAPSVAELTQAAKTQPNDAQTQLALGHAAFDEGNRALALESYRRALKLDPTVATERLTSNLLGCFGQDEQWAAAALLSKYQLVDAEPSLRTLTNHRAHHVRTTALETLGKLGKATADDTFRVLVADLRVKDCGVRQAAVRSLAEAGDRRALEPIRQARDKDIEETPWYGVRCLRSESDSAIVKLTRTRFSTRPPAPVASR